MKGKINAMKLKTYDLIITAVFAALMVVGAYLRVPVPPVPVSLQPFFCVFSGMILGAKLGAVSQTVYMLAGLAGFPVFTQGGGITYIFKPSFGYILGFVLGSYVTGTIIKSFSKKNFISLMISSLGGLFGIYAIGVPYIYLIMKLYMKQDGFTFISALTAGLTPFIIKDIVLFALAALIASRVMPLLEKAGYRTGFSR